MSRQDLTDVVSTALAGLAVFLQIVVGLLLVVAVLALFWRPARRLLLDLRDILGGKEIWIAWVVALIATLGSLFFSEFSNFVPCRLCWFQRIGMYPLSVILLVGALRKDVRAAVQYAFVFPIFGILVASYHLYIEANPGEESAKCKIGASCATKWIDEFGYVTIPMLSMTAFVAIAALLAFAWSRRNAVDDDTTALDEPA